MSDPGYRAEQLIIPGLKHFVLETLEPAIGMLTGYERQNPRGEERCWRRRGASQADGGSETATARRDHVHLARASRRSRRRDEGGGSVAVAEGLCDPVVEARRAACAGTAVGATRARRGAARAGQGAGGGAHPREGGSLIFINRPRASCGRSSRSGRRWSSARRPSGSGAAGSTRGGPRTWGRSRRSGRRFSTPRCRP